MTACIICPPAEDGGTHDPDYVRGFLCCFRAWGRMATALRQIPELCDELAGLGYIQRDTRSGQRASTFAYDVATRRRHLVYEPAPADPVSSVLPSGPLNGSRGAPRVSGSPDARIPIRIDPTDLLARSRPASLAVAVTGAHAQDQIGHLAVATELEFWVRDWADQRNENAPVPLVPILCRWLLDRLDWACQHHPALDEFAGALRRVHGALYGLCGYGEQGPEPVDRPCDSCGYLGLSRPPDSDYIVCGNCGRALTDDEYTSHLKEVIAMKWTLYDSENAKAKPAPTTPVWVRSDEVDAVTIGYLVGGKWRSWGGSEINEVSYWAPITYPADPGRAKVDS